MDLKGSSQAESAGPAATTVNSSTGLVAGISAELHSGGQHKTFQRITISPKSFAEGLFLKKYMVEATDIVSPEKCQAFANIGISKKHSSQENLIICKVSFRTKQRPLLSFPPTIVTDKNTNATDTAQLVVLGQGVHQDMEVTEEFVELVPKKDNRRGSFQ